MQSGRIARYKVTSERFSYTFDDTGQRNWLWQFQGYEPANAKVSGAGTASAGLPGWQANGETE
jgi:hypothetical protein